MARKQDDPSLSLDQMKLIATNRGLTIEEISAESWKIAGGHFVVEFNPLTRTITVDGSRSSLKGGPLLALKLVHDVMPKTTKVRRQSNKRIKDSLLKEDPTCHWCKKQNLADDDATVDHKVPLSRNGSDKQDNKVLACKKCNAGKADGPPQVVTQSAPLTPDPSYDQERWAELRARERNADGRDRDLGSRESLVKMQEDSLRERENGLRDREDIMRDREDSLRERENILRRREERIYILEKKHRPARPSTNPPMVKPARCLAPGSAQRRR